MTITPISNTQILMQELLKLMQLIQQPHYNVDYTTAIFVPSVGHPTASDSKALSDS